MITVVGEALADLIEQAAGPPIAHPGGSPANVAVALARLGQRTSLLTQLGGDAHGQLLIEHLRHNGVALAPGSLTDCPRTSTALTQLNTDGQASYTFDIAWRHFPTAADSWPDPEMSCVHTGSLATMLAPGAGDVLSLVRAARDTAIVSFDPNLRPSLAGDRHSAQEQVGSFVACSDIVKASIEDLAWLYPGRSMYDISREWLNHGAQLVVITMGANGAWACTAHREVMVPAVPTSVVDTVGAGDAFTAAMLTALNHEGLLNVTRRPELAAINEATLTSVLTFASRAAAVTCGRRGADPPTLADLVTAETW